MAENEEDEAPRSVGEVEHPLVSRRRTRRAHIIRDGKDRATKALEPYRNSSDPDYREIFRNCLVDFLHLASDVGLSAGDLKGLVDEAEVLQGEELDLSGPGNFIQVFERGERRPKPENTTSEGKPPAD